MNKPDTIKLKGKLASLDIIKELALLMTHEKIGMDLPIFIQEAFRLHNL